MTDDVVSDEKEPASASASDESWGCMFSVVVIVLLVIGRWGWDALDSRGYIYHDKLTAVSGEGWAVGEYKDCFSLNIKMKQPVLSCDNLLGGDKERVFKVRFYGTTYREETPDNAAIRWKCMKNGQIDPAITCEKR
jgi:hypothetical protein